MRVCVIGGGLAGLTAGYQLSHDFDVVIFEKDSQPGGLLSSYHTKRYSIERYYHHFFSGDCATMALLSGLGLEDTIVWLSGSTGSFTGGCIHAMTTPLEILRYPHLTFTDKIRLGLFTRKASRMDISALDQVTAHDYILEVLGDRIYQSFFKPLLNSKFGQNADRVSAAWLMSRVAIRSDRGISGERLGYLIGGFAVMVDRLVSGAQERGAQIRLDTPVQSVSRHSTPEKDGWMVDGEFFDILIGTASPSILTRIGVPGIPAVPYQGAACMVLALSRDVTGGIYWLNVTDPAPYGAVVAHTNFAPYDWYGEHIVYLASYFSGEADPDIKEKMLSDFCTKFSVQPDEILWSRLTIDREAGPLYLTGYKNSLIEPRLPGLYLAGMFSPENYPERSIEGSIRAAERVVEDIRSREYHR